MKRKNVISLVAFILCAVIMTSMLSHLFRDKESSFDNYYLQPEDTIDAFFVGSSHVYSGYCPAVLWEEYGISAYNVYAWSMPIWTGYYYLCEALKTQSPDIVFMDMSSFIQNGGEYGAAEEKTVDNREQNLWFAPGIERLLLTLESLTPDTETFDLELFHNKWKHPEKLEWTSSPDTDIAMLRNFGPLFGNVEFGIFNYSWDTMVAPPSETGYKYLEKIVDLAEKEDFRLVFVLTPYESNEMQNAVNNWLHAYASEKGIDYIDFMMEPGIECGFDYQADMADADHVNAGGAFKLTRYCGDYMRSLGICDRWDNPNAAQLDKDAAATFRIFEYTDLLGDSANIDAISSWLRDSDAYSAAVIFPDNISDAQQIFADKLSITDASGKLAVLENGDVVDIGDFSAAGNHIELPGMQCVIDQDNGTISVKLQSGIELMPADAADLCIAIYDQPMERLVYAVSVRPDGSFTVFENTRTIRGAAEN